MPIVRPPFGKSIDFLEPIPSRFLIFLKVDPRPVSRPRSSCQQTGNPCRSHRQRFKTPSEKDCSDETPLSPRRRSHALDDRQRLLLRTVPWWLWWLWLSATLWQLRTCLWKLWLCTPSLWCRSLLELPRRWLWRAGSSDAARRVLRGQLRHGDLADFANAGSADRGRQRPAHVLTGSRIAVG
jgi:hypothetical protein